MEKVRLGKAGLMASKLGLGGVPLQRLSQQEAVTLVIRCLDLGINFLDTAAEYPLGEEPIGKAIRGRRDEIILSTKARGTRQEVEAKLKESLKKLGVSYIDLYQLHGVNTFEMYRNYLAPEGPLAVMQQAKKAGLIKHIGITSHSIEVAKEAVKSSLFETIMFPFNFITSEPADELLPLATQHDVGFIAMKPLAGGLLDSAGIAFKYLFQFPDVISIPGIQKVSEIEEIVELYQGSWKITAAEQAEMQRLKKDLNNKLCRRCNMCEPCPEKIPVLQVVDLMPFIINMPPAYAYSDPIADKLQVVKNCTRCGECEKNCPYGLPVMDMVRENFKTYQEGRAKYLKQVPAR